MSAVWPAGLPQNLRTSDLQETMPDTVLRTQMDAGPAKARRRFTAAPRPFSGSLVMTQAQVEVFDAFFVDVVAGGALQFEWKFPRTGTICDVRFTNKPQLRPTGPRAIDKSEYWIVEVELETVPGTDKVSPGGPGPGVGLFFPAHMFNDADGGLPGGFFDDDAGAGGTETGDWLAVGVVGPGGPLGPIGGGPTAGVPYNPASPALMMPDIVAYSDSYFTGVVDASMKP